MGDTCARADTAHHFRDGVPTTRPDVIASSTPQHSAYWTQDFTPPTSPQPQHPYVAKRGYGVGRPHHPVPLQMNTAVAPVYDHHTHSPSPSDTIPSTGAPSPKYSSRQRAPSLLRHAAMPSPSAVTNGFGRMDQPLMSPKHAPTMMRQASGPGSPDLRTIFNPLASNPVNQSGPAWDIPGEPISQPSSPLRARGLTSASQPSFQPAAPLRSVTSIPDYSLFRGNRPHLSGAYKPNRGVANWSHTDYYPQPPRRFRGEESRASVRSGWTNASSNFMEASGTERSSIITGRSSITSEHQASIYSREQSRDRLRDRDGSPETIQTQTSAPEDDEDNVVDAVNDLIDEYCYDEEDEEEVHTPFDQHSRDRLSTSLAALDSEPPELSQTPSRDLDSLSSFHSSEHLKQWDERPSSYLRNSSDSNAEKIAPSQNYVSARDPTTEDPETGITEEEDSQTIGLPILQHDQTHRLPLLQDKATLDLLSSREEPSGHHRSSEELPRRVSVLMKGKTLGAPNTMSRHSQLKESGPPSTAQSYNRAQMSSIQREITKLPQIPTTKSRMSRQDWAEISAYSKRHSKRPSASRTISNDSIKNGPALQSPPIKKSVPLPELDEDEAIPRRASTSVYDRKSALFNLGQIASAVATQNKPLAMQDASIAPSQPSSVKPLRKAAAPVERDRYGFKKASDRIDLQSYNAWSTKYEEHVSRRRTKWIALMTKQGLSTTDPTKFPEPNEKVKRYVRKGYPPEWRGAMWWYYSGGQHTMAQKDMIGLYASLVTRVRAGELNKDDKDGIERDLDRTFPDNIHFRPEPSTDLLDGEADDEPQLIQDLREVLSCFALNNPNIGYCQSLNFIAGLLLLFLKQDKERAFIMLTIITRNHLPGAHARNLANTEVNVLMMLIKDYLPKVWASINDTDLVNSGAGSNAHPNSKFQRQPTVALSCTSWFMSIFVGVLPIETVLRVWDSFLYEGPRALYRYALAIFKLGENEIRKFKPADPELFMVVQNLPRTCIDPNVLHDFAFVKKGFGSLSQSVIDQKRMFWREQNHMTHQTSVRSIMRIATTPPRDDETDGDSIKRSVGGLRRRASRKFRTFGTRRGRD